MCFGQMNERINSKHLIVNVFKIYFSFLWNPVFSPLLILYNNKSASLDFVLAS